MKQSPISSLASAFGAAGAIALASGCADEPTHPRDAAAPQPAEVSRSLGLSADARGQLRAALLFAGTQSILALQQRDAGDRVAAAFARLAERVEADDAAGTELALAAARQAVKRYREVAGADGGAAAVDLAAMDLTIERATQLASESRAAYGDDRTRTASTSPIAPHSREERQP